MKKVIDRFEGEFAVVELPDGRFCNIPKCALPKGAGEGDVILLSIKEKSDVESQISDLMDKLFK